jgi:hypothetical protein
MSHRQRADWKKWSASGNTYDPIFATDDPKPARLFIKKALTAFIRYPRSTIKKYFFA